jgi:hypothetical protein
VVPNGIPLSKIHHAAFDAHLIGIDPDYRLRPVVPTLPTAGKRLKVAQRSLFSAPRFTSPPAGVKSDRRGFEGSIQAQRNGSASPGLRLNGNRDDHYGPIWRPAHGAMSPITLTGAIFISTWLSARLTDVARAGAAALGCPVRAELASDAELEVIGEGRRGAGGRAGRAAERVPAGEGKRRDNNGVASGLISPNLGNADPGFPARYNQGHGRQLVPTRSVPDAE